MFKKLINSGLFFLITILVATFILTLLNYFNLLNPNIISFLKRLVPLIAIFISGYKLGISSEKKGYIEGIKIGSIIIITFTILTLLLDQFTFKSLLYYSILLLTSILGSMIGINRKKTTS